MASGNRTVVRMAASLKITGFGLCPPAWLLVLGATQRQQRRPDEREDGGVTPRIGAPRALSRLQKPKYNPLTA